MLDKEWCYSGRPNWARHAVAEFNELHGETPGDTRRTREKTSIADSTRSRTPGGPAITSGRILRLNCPSRTRKGTPPKWSPCKWLRMIQPIWEASTPERFIAINDDVPQSMRTESDIPARRKHV